MKENIVKAFFEIINEDTLRVLPCFFDYPGTSQFRIGINEGPIIEFVPANRDLNLDMYYEYYFKIRLDKDDTDCFQYEVNIESDYYPKFNEINTLIRKLLNNEEYISLLQGNNANMFIELKQAVTYILNPKKADINLTL